jgi:hypothetical protein
MRYCDIDLHSNNSVVVISGEEDRIVFNHRLPNDLEQIGRCWRRIEKSWRAWSSRAPTTYTLMEGQGRAKASKESR